MAASADGREKASRALDIITCLKIDSFMVTLPADRQQSRKIKPDKSEFYLIFPQLQLSLVIFLVSSAVNVVSGYRSALDVDSLRCENPTFAAGRS